MDIGVPKNEWLVTAYFGGIYSRIHSLSSCEIPVSGSASVSDSRSLDDDPDPGMSDAEKELTLRYLNYKTWEDIADELNCSARKVHIVHSKALSDVIIPRI